MTSHIPSNNLFEGDSPRPNHFRTRSRVLSSAREILLDGPKAMIEARYSRSQGIIMALSALPSILGLLSLTMPEVLFPTEDHRAFFQFAKNMANDPMGITPIVIGTISTLLGLRVPVS